MAICMDAVSALRRVPIVMSGFSGAPVTLALELVPPLAALLVLDPELHALMPTASPATANTSALRYIREAFIGLLL